MIVTAAKSGVVKIEVAQPAKAAEQSSPPPPSPNHPAALQVRRSMSFVGMPPSEPDSEGLDALHAMSTAAPFGVVAIDVLDSSGEIL